MEPTGSTLTPPGDGDVAQDLLCIADASGRLRRLAGPWYEVLGWTESELMGRPYLDFVHPDDLAETARIVRAVRDPDAQVVGFKNRVAAKTGGWRTLRWSAQSDGVSWYAVARDVSATSTSAEPRDRASSRAAEEHDLLVAIMGSTHDAIFSQSLDGRVETWNRGAEELYGHAAEEAIGRYADELIIPEDRPQDGRLVIEQVLAGTKLERYETRRRRKDGQLLEISLTASAIRDASGATVGVSIIDRDITERKRTERARLDRAAGNTWEARIARALEHDGFVLFAQPIIDLDGGRKQTEEMLIRMRGDRGEDDFVPPAMFMAVAERFGLINEIDRWVIEHAVPLAADGNGVAINLSGRSIGDPTMPGAIERCIAGNGVDPRLITFEITETAAVMDLPSARMFAERLGRLGAKLALDDFGTGYGTFTYLKHLPAQFIKIDGEFIVDMSHNAQSAELVTAITEVAQRFGIRTIAECVEDAETLVALPGRGVDYAQGYHIGRPRPHGRGAPRAVRGTG
jgi:PAS domain S-box-containing protein